MTYAKRHFEQAVDAFDKGAVEPQAMISGTIGLQALPAMFEALRERTPYCKVQVDPWA